MCLLLLASAWINESRGSILLQVTNANQIQAGQNLYIPGCLSPTGSPGSTSGTTTPAPAAKDSSSNAGGAPWPLRSPLVLMHAGGQGCLRQIIASAQR